MSNRRSALGRGLGALISTPPQTDRRPGAEAAQPPPSETSRAADAAPQLDGPPAGAVELPVSAIAPNAEQPRRQFDPEHLEKLAASILQHGVLQPVVVRRLADERYELIVGERRWRASRAAGLETIPAVVKDVADEQRLEVAIVENVQRHDLNPIELAHAYRALADAGATQEEIGRKVSMDRSSVANHLRLLDLSRDLQEDIEHGRITMGHAKALLQVGNPERRRHLRDEVVERGLSVRATEELGREIAGPAPPRAPRKTRAERALDPALQTFVDQLQQRFQTRVHLKGDGKRGRVEIEYFSAEELERVADVLLGDR